MSAPILPVLPPLAPRLPDNAFRWLLRGVLRLSGWRLLGEFPNVPKLVLIGAPHSSNWDAVWGLMMKVGMGLDIKIMIKRELLEGPFGAILRPLGLIPINRRAALNVIGQMVAQFDQHERMWLGITPEGTRKAVVEWKAGFLRIAREANVPIQTMFVDYPSKTFTLGPLVHASDDPEADMAAIRALFVGYRGKYRNVV